MYVFILDAAAVGLPNMKTWRKCSAMNCHAEGRKLFSSPVTSVNKNSKLSSAEKNAR